MNDYHPFLGVMLMLVFCVLAPLRDSIAKLLGGAVALGVLIFVRFAIQAVVLMPLVLLKGQTLRLPKGILIWTLVRTVLHILGIGLMFTALRYLPLADALAIAFVMPFIMSLLGYSLMGEQVGIHRMGACAVGFVGTLLVIQPNFVDGGFSALYPLGVAVVFSLFMMVTRKIARDGPNQTAGYQRHSGDWYLDCFVLRFPGCSRRFQYDPINGNVGSFGWAWLAGYVRASFHDMEPAFSAGINSGTNAVS
jgi:drug/metabolite transporter (DMT)-like permease